MAHVCEQSPAQDDSVLIRPSDLSQRLGAGFGTRAVEVCIPLTADFLLIFHNVGNDGQVGVVAPTQALSARNRVTRTPTR
jgi:hypothetical protein